MLGGTINVKRHSESVLATMVLFASANSVFAQSSSEVLAKLSENLSIVRSASGTELVGTEPIDVEGLLGVSRTEIANVLGNPSSCDQATTETCNSQSQWQYLFFYLPPGWRGGGPELWLTFNSAGEVEKAEWRHSR